ncbi:prefoldin subunit 2 [Patella vulgata]|uniref:prefoldin subunit 2 n=1 Tax=Patella vulgata TaxID=6465 RepID=UPI00218022A3|nr:prefoldin subunit 2 [Patella vulgata]
MSEIEMDIKEHELVIDTLKEVDEGRKCYRMVGGVLVERTVKDVLPALTNNKEQMSKLVETLSKQMETKGSEINKFREQHNLKIRGEDSKEIEGKDQDASKSGASGVLVAKDS